MATPTATPDSDTRDGATQARTAAARVQRDLDRSEQTATYALRDLVRAWTDSIRLFVPPVVLHPGAAIRITATAVEQIIELQRRFLEELLSASRDVVVATDIEPMQVQVRGNGRAA